MRSMSPVQLSRFLQPRSRYAVALLVALTVSGAGAATHGPAARAASPTYTATDLGFLPGGIDASASAINDSGQVAGYSDLSSGQRHAFSWTAGGGMQDLGTLQDVTELDPTALSGSGQIAGNTLKSGTDADAFSWTASGGLVDVGTLGGNSSHAVAVNDNGQVAGFSPLSGFSGTERPFIWTQAAGLRNLGTLGGNQAEATAMNGSGQVVGWSYTSAGDRHSFSWTNAGNMIDLTSNGFGNSEALALNDTGAVVGDGVNSGGREDAFLWTQGGGMQDLGVLPGAVYSIASAISSGGQVAGTSGYAGNVLHAFVWSEGNGMVDIGSLGGSQTAPTAISDNGTVVGWSFTANGRRHAFVWTAADGMIDLAPNSFGSQANAVNADGQIVGSVDGRAFLWQLPSGPPPGLVQRSGTNLVVDGQPYRPIGLNIYNANSSGNCWYDLAHGSTLDDSLSAIGTGKNAIRAWFFQDLATTNGQRDWSAFDHTLAVARAHGVKVIATLANQWADCEPAAGYKTPSWYTDGYKQVDPGGTVSYRDWVQEVAARYKDDPTVMAWQLLNEPEIGDCGAVPESSAVDILSSFASDVSGAIKAVDPNHLISLGTIGSGQCGAQGADYKTVMNVPTLDLCEFHDYTPSQLIPGDPFNGLQVRINQCNQLGKPILVGELGVKPSDVGGTLAARANTVASKLCAQLSAGVAGVLLWAWDKDGSLLDNFDIGPGDPVLDGLGPWSDPAHTCSAPAPPSGAVAAAGDQSASVSWVAPASDGGSPVTAYTVTASPGGQVATTDGSTTTAIVRNLANGTAYTFAVTATNAAGTSSASTATGSVTPKSGNTAASGIASAAGGATVTTGSDPATSGGLASSVQVPAGTSGGGVTITQTATNVAAPTGYLFGGVQADISAPPGTATNPLTLKFTLTPQSDLAPPPDPATLAAAQIFRAESGLPVLVPDCPGVGQALPDGSPCVSNRQYVGANIQLTVLTATASHWLSARPKPGAVTVSDSGYSPPNVTLQPGAYVNWTWSGKKSHSVTDSVGLGASGQPLFNSGLKSSGSYRFTFPAAGTFAYKSTAKGDSSTGSVLVPVVITPTSGPSATTFSVIWSGRALSGYTFTVQYRFKPTGSNKWTSWTTWQNAVTSTTARFTPSQGAGTYDFHALLRNASTGRASSYSPDTLLTVS